jgi:hypothetical protein
MPRKSPFIINPSSEERQMLESTARKYTSSYCDVIHAKIILLANEGLSEDVMASRLDRYAASDCQQMAQAIRFCPIPWH